MTGRIPAMPSRLEDVPAWLRYNASRLSFRILFLADELAAHLEHRAALEAVAHETGIRLVDLPVGLTEQERETFIREHLAADLAAERAADHDPRLWFFRTAAGTQSRTECNEWNGYRVGHDRHEYVCPDWPHVLEETATRPLAADTGRLAASMLNAALAAPCPHCGEVCAPGQMARHVRDTGDTAGRERPPHACPVLWRKRGGQ